MSSDESPTFDVVNPATGQVVRSIEGHSRAYVERCLVTAQDAWEKWRRTDISERSTILKRAADILDVRRDELAGLMTLEMGKPVAQSRSEVEKCAWVCRYYAENAAGFLQARDIPTSMAESSVVYRPLGVILAVMPWNFPLWQVFRFAAPALMGGNVGLLKHASNVPGCALAVAEIFAEAGLPQGVFQTLLVRSGAVATLLADRRVAGVTLTGSEAAGSAVASEAGRHIKPSLLELGGSDPYLILEDADLELAVRECVTSRMLNSGQSCIAAKRLIAVDSVYDDVLRLLRHRIQALQLGDPLEPGTDVGPQATVALRDELHDQVERAVAAGAQIEVGGVVPDRPGAWYPPTLLVDVGPDNPAFREELFGPVATLIRAEDEHHAIRLANDCAYGLGAAVFTQDVERGRRIAEEELHAGACFVNGFVRSDPRLPFGGVKLSGYGRELAQEGLYAFMNAKTVVVV